MAFWPTFLNTEEGVLQADKKLLELAEVLQKSSLNKIMTIILPSTLPYLFAGLRLSISRAGDRFNMGKIFGILGGMGPLATAEFYKRIVEMTAASQDSDHVETIIYSNSKIPKRVEYIMGENTDNPGPVLVDTVFKLISAGAEVIAMPCVMAHFLSII